MTNETNIPDIGYFDPRELPEHLVCGAVFLGVNTPDVPALEAFLARFGCKLPYQKDLWLIEVWDRAQDGKDVAAAMFSLTDGHVDCLLLWTDPEYVPAVLEKYLRHLGQSLWGRCQITDTQSRNH